MRECPLPYSKLYCSALYLQNRPCAMLRGAHCSSPMCIAVASIFADHPPDSPYAKLVGNALDKLDPDANKAVGEPVSLEEREQGAHVHTCTCTCRSTCSLACASRVRMSTCTCMRWPRAHIGIHVGVAHRGVGGTSWMAPPTRSLRVGRLLRRL